MALNYNFINYGAKADINDKVSVGVFFDQPWGADVEFTGNNDFVNDTEQAALAAKDRGVSTDSFVPLEGVNCTVEEVGATWATLSATGAAV